MTAQAEQALLLLDLAFRLLARAAETHGRIAACHANVSRTEAEREIALQAAAGAGDEARIAS